MARICDLCGKGHLKANLVARGIGNRVTQRTLRTQKPNLRTVRMQINGRNKATMRICTSCLKRIKNDVKLTQSAEAETK